MPAIVRKASSRSEIGPVVTIFLATLYGERFLPEQLASLERQTFKNWRLIASDDGSSDRTQSILHAFQKSFEPGKVEIVAGPRRGAPANFLFLACAEDLRSNFHAFCDQDDVWEPDKLARAADLLQKAIPDIPTLDGSRTRLIDENGNEIGFSPLFPRTDLIRSQAATDGAAKFLEGLALVAASKLRENPSHSEQPSSNFA